EQNGKIVADGADLNGNHYHLETTLSYELLNGKALLISSYSSTHSWADDGSESWTSRNVSYGYDNDGTLTGASGDSYTEGYYKDKIDENGNEVRGDFYDTNAVQTYKIIEGEAQVVKSTATTYVYEDNTRQTVFGSSESRTCYAYDVVLGIARLTRAVTKTHSEDYQNFDPDGNPGIRDERMVVTYSYNEVGSVIGASGNGSATGTELGNDGWLKFSSEITTTYGIFNGAAFEINRHEEKTSTPWTDAVGDPEGSSPYDPWTMGTLEIVRGHLALVVDPDDVKKASFYQMDPSILTGETPINEDGKMIFMLAVDDDATQAELEALVGQEVNLMWQYYTKSSAADSSGYGWIWLAPTSDKRVKYHLKKDSQSKVEQWGGSWDRTQQYVVIK
ncbi:hypothetical protein KA005_28810, partial [bacterium]|nr:hypothetical protein [bacterium]